MRRVIVALVVARLLLGATGGSGGFSNPLAYATLTRYGTTPVLARGGSGAWDEAQLGGEMVFYDTRLKTWVMAYTGVSAGGVLATGLAYSRNLLDWTKEATNPVFTANATEGNIATANIVQISGSSYRMYYQSYNGTDGGARLYAATSSDLLSWNRYNANTPILTPGAGASWDSEFVFDQEIEVYGGTTYLYYGGQKSGPTRGIGYATAADGFTFTKYGSNPILTPSGGESAVNLGAPSVYGADGTTFDMWYDSSTVADHRYINHARTTNGGSSWSVDYNWFGPGSGWDSGQVFDPAAVVHGGVLYLFYAGSTSTGGGVGFTSEIGLATMAWS